MKEELTDEELKKITQRKKEEIRQEEWTPGKVEHEVYRASRETENYEKGKRETEKARQFTRRRKAREVTRRQKRAPGMDEVERLEDFERTRGKLRLPSDIKPCIIKLLDDPSVKDGDKPFIVACELHRVGKTEKEIDSILVSLSIGASRIRGVIKSVITGKYEFGCPRLEERGICLYKSREDCFWYQAIPRESQRSYRERDFWRFGWPGKLTAPEIVIYMAIKEVEKRRGLSAGSRLYVSRKELMRVSGVSHGWVLECCERLKKKGLIEFKRGTQHRWYGKASEIKRIIPIPRSE